MKLLTTVQKNAVIRSMIIKLKKEEAAIIAEYKKDRKAFQKENQALYDRLVVTPKKIGKMVKALQEIHDQEDPTGRILYQNTLKNGLKIMNKSAPFGTLLIIYESRPDVTIEAAVLAFKAGNK